jgi:hypothetical protein
MLQQHSRFFYRIINIKIIFLTNYIILTLYGLQKSIFKYCSSGMLFICKVSSSYVFYLGERKYISFFVKVKSRFFFEKSKVRILMQHSLFDRGDLPWIQKKFRVSMHKVGIFKFYFHLRVCDYDSVS